MALCSQQLDRALDALRVRQASVGREQRRLISQLYYSVADATDG